MVNFLQKRKFDHMFANKGNKRRIQKFLKHKFAFFGKAREVKVIYSVCDKGEDISCHPIPALKGKNAKILKQTQCFCIL